MSAVAGKALHILERCKRQVEPTRDVCLTSTEAQTIATALSAQEAAQLAVVQRLHRIEKEMQIQCLHQRGSCSSLIIFDFDEDWSFKKFWQWIQISMDKQVTYSSFGSAKNYAFVVASTNKSYVNVKGYLKALGFQNTPEVYNKKNGTEAQLHFIPVPMLMEKLKEFENESPEVSSSSIDDV